MINRPVERLSAPLLADHLHDRLVEAVIFGDLPAEARLVEDSIAEQYGVSRSPVRDVLRKMEAEGLLTREGAKGLNVAPISRRDLDEVYLCRIPLEGIAAAEAAVNRSPDGVEALEAIYARMREAQQAGGVRDYFLANVAFTDAIHAAARNATLVRLLGGLSKQAQRYRYAAYTMFPHLMDLSVEGSRKIVDAIAETDADRARSVTETLIKQSWLTIRDCFHD
ncbi:GntR family transcriptional regulator [Methylobacterium nonmethylotrophicum]|uniref:GntR family transcriptional regulator n=1 Tax=Methylobacterium nonmethylotrophicum TaxID=1141884 RepID=A0A4Z0NPF6_9HYPH|nr:GntR family transcriptional regulator [Methylobacterium nonmethylotrophicum]TGD97613.1 GntR family transcriptional regulator [Methylobacterium nonmethylotrophicum]